MIIKLQQYADQIIRSKIIYLDSYRIREDLYACYQDIRQQIHESAPGEMDIIYDYADLLQKRIEQWQPEDAFEAGAVLSCYAKDDDSQLIAFMRYVYRVAASQEAMALENKIQQMFNLICDLLGDTYGLLVEFNELYMECNGVFMQKIHEFFEMGYNSMGSYIPTQPDMEGIA